MRKGIKKHMISGVFCKNALSVPIVVAAMLMLAGCGGGKNHVAAPVPETAQKEEFFFPVEDSSIQNENEEGRNASAASTDCVNKITLTDTGQIIGTKVTSAPLAPKARAIYAEDLDGNGSKDLISGAYKAGVTLYSNNGSGAYSIKPPVLTSTQPIAVNSVDMDRDGDNDVIIGDYARGLYIYRNLGNWRFQLAQTVVWAGVTAIGAADLDNRNGVDLVVANYKYATKVCFNNGSGTYTCSGTIGTYIQTKSLVVMDVTGDGTPDVVQGNYRVYPKPLAESIRIWKNNGAGAFTLVPQTSSYGLYGINAVVGSDIDKDGDNDLVVASYIGGVGARGQGMLLTNDGTGKYTNAALSGLNVWNSNSLSIAVADYDKDTYPDIASGNYVGGANYNEVWFNDGSSKFKKACDNAGFKSKSWDIFAVDVDNDGMTDIIDGAGSSVKVWKTGRYVSAIICSSDSDCSAPKPYCVNPGTAQSICIPCKTNADCNDSNTLTTDVCNSPNTITAACVNTACSIECSSDANCNDNLLTTVDTCSNPGTCSADCVYTTQNVAVTATVSPTSGRTSDTYTVTCAGTGGTVQQWEAKCSATSSYSVITGTTKACTYTTAGTYTPYCRANGVTEDAADTVTVSACVSNSDCSSPKPYCLSPGTTTAACITCRTDADCADTNPLTTDTCNSANTSSSSCSNSACVIACSSDANCLDSNLTDVDTCSNPGTCSATCVHTPQNVTVTATVSPTSGRTSDTYTLTCSGTGGTVQQWEAKCSATSSYSVITGNTKACSYGAAGTYTPYCRANGVTEEDASTVTVSACQSNSHCSSPKPYCLSPGTTTAACITCRTDADCADTNSLTTDTCNSANTTSSSCSNTLCSVACSSDANCLDGNLTDVDTCSNPGTCSAACVHTPQNVSVTATISTTSGRTSDSYVLTCSGTGGTVQQWEAKCSASSSYAVITGNTKTCAYASTGTYTPYCRANGVTADDASTVTVAECLSDSHCSSPTPYCLSPTLVSADCIQCRTVADCDDSNAFTVDACNSANTSSSACTHTVCTAVCSADADCSDGDMMTDDTCSNPGVCAASCNHTPLNITVSASVNTTSSYRNSPITLTCGATGGTISLLEGKCSSTDPSWTTIAGSTMSCSYPANGTYTPQCRANQSPTASASQVTITGVPPVASASGDVTIGLSPLSVSFSGSCTDIDGTCVSYSWDFGDGASSSSQNPSHTYSGTGGYTATLTVTDNEGLTHQATVSIGLVLPITMAAGSLHTCAIKQSTGGLKCWGSNSNGQLGFSAGSMSTTPGNVTNMTSGVLSVTAGPSVTCAVKTSGAYCWGLNSNAQLGDGTSTSRSTPTQVSGLDASSGVAQLDVGNAFACAIVGGGVKCWGQNNYGQLGDGTTTTSKVPISVVGLSNVKEISLGLYHACALLHNGTVKCWGHNSYKQLGNNSTTHSPSPITVNIPSVSALARGGGAGFLTCALLTSGEVYCWGINDVGQCGDASTTSPKAIPGYVFTDSGRTTRLASVTNLSTQHNHACAVTNGAAYCWGKGGTINLSDGGFLGIGSTASRTYAVPTLANSGIDYVVVGGSGQTTNHGCAMTTTNTISCWGNNVNGQLGIGSTTSKTSPTSVAGF